MFSRIHQGIETALAWLLNPFFFHLRNLIRFRRKKPFKDTPVSLNALPAYAQSQLKSERYGQLQSRYNLERYQDQLSYSSLYGAYFFLDVLAQSFELVPKDMAKGKQLKVLDVGTKNFDAAPALYQFFRNFDGQPDSVNVSLTGIEIDAYRVYRSLYSRHDVGMFYRDLISHAGEKETHRYLAGDLLKHDEKYDVVTCFFPFVSSFALLAWGLPTVHLKPERFVEHLVSRLNPGGRAIIVNQTEAERDIQVGLFQAASVKASSFEITLNFREDQPVAYLHIIEALELA